MKRVLNTLYVMTQGAYLKKEGEAIAVRAGGETKLRVPIVSIGSIVCFGDAMISPALMGHCAKCGVIISYLSAYGRFLARIEGPTTGNVLLRREQYRISDDRHRSALIARAIVAAKIANCRSVMLRAVRDHAEQMKADEVSRAADELKGRIDAALEEKDLDRLRGIEGDAAHVYFNVFDELIVAQKADFSFRDRNRRPPLDRVNALLSFVYTMLYHDLRSALETTGLDPAVGFLHRDRPGRMSLALDVMEEFRPFIAERLVLSLINLKQIDQKGLTISESGAVLLSEAGRKIVVSSYQKRKQDTLVHPFVGEEMHVGIVLQTQALLLARHIRGDLDGYPAFVWK
ncbi:MAG TPA: type I-C CRISPR-associated endonuclease Cas1c [Spirochaetia bacterium]